MKIDIDGILLGIQDGKSKRTQESLNKLHSILTEYVKSGGRDFSVTNIGRISSNNGGPGYASLRATKNSHFRELIKVWAESVQCDMKKPVSKHSRTRKMPSDMKLLERLGDPALRAVFGNIIAERNRLKKEVGVLKAQTELNIDMRPLRQFDAKNEAQIEVVSGVHSLLIQREIDALKTALSAQCAIDNGWDVNNKTGQVRSKDTQQEILPRGFMTALKKLITEIEKSADS